MATTQPKYNTAHLDEADLRKLIQLIKGKVDGLKATDKDLLCALNKLKEEVDEIWHDKETGVKDITYNPETNTLTFELVNGKKVDIKLNDFTDRNVVQKKITEGERRLLLTGVKKGGATTATTTAYADGVSFDAANKVLNAENITVSGKLKAKHIESEEIDDMFKDLYDKLERFNDLREVAIAGDDGCVAYGSGIYAVGEEVQVTAIVKEGYRFVRWSNGVTDQTFILAVEDSIELFAETEVNPDTRVTRQAYIQTYDLNGVRREMKNFVFSSNDEGEISVYLCNGGVILQVDQINNIINPRYLVPFDELEVISDTNPSLYFSGNRFDFNVPENGMYNLRLQGFTKDRWVLTKI